MAMTLEKSQGAARAELVNNLGNPDLSSEKIESLRALIVETGAVADVEKLIDRLGEESRVAANSSAIHADARPFLLALAETAIRRSH
jgi:geranylgeranyl diphosphate synthase type I